MFKYAVRLWSKLLVVIVFAFSSSVALAEHTSYISCIGTNDDKCFNYHWISNACPNEGFLDDSCVPNLRESFFVHNHGYKNGCLPTALYMILGFWDTKGWTAFFKAGSLHSYTNLPYEKSDRCRNRDIEELIMEYEDPYSFCLYANPADENTRRQDCDWNSGDSQCYCYYHEYECDVVLAGLEDSTYWQNMKRSKTEMHDYYDHDWYQLARITMYHDNTGGQYWGEIDTDIASKTLKIMKRMDPDADGKWDHYWYKGRRAAHLKRITRPVKKGIPRAYCYWWARVKKYEDIGQAHYATEYKTTPHCVAVNGYLQKATQLNGGYSFKGYWWVFRTGRTVSSNRFASLHVTSLWGKRRVLRMRPKIDDDGNWEQSVNQEYIDMDQDGFNAENYVPVGWKKETGQDADCNDFVSSINPSAHEYDACGINLSCCDGIDNNCSGDIDRGDLDLLGYFNSFGNHDDDEDCIPASFDSCPNTMQSADSDNDCIEDAEDRCPDIYNPEDEDSDQDCILDIDDPCPDVYNPASIDPDQDCRRSGTDPHTGITYDEDFCPESSNPEDIDRDGDCITGTADTCPYLFMESGKIDDDGFDQDHDCYPDSILYYQYYQNYGDNHINALDYTTIIPLDNCSPSIQAHHTTCPYPPDFGSQVSSLCCNSAHPDNCTNKHQENTDFLTEVQDANYDMYDSTDPYWLNAPFIGDQCDVKPALAPETLDYSGYMPTGEEYWNHNSRSGYMCSGSYTTVSESTGWKIPFLTKSTNYYANRSALGDPITLNPPPDRTSRPDERKVGMTACICRNAICDNCLDNITGDYNIKKIQYTPKGETSSVTIHSKDSGWGHLEQFDKVNEKDRLDSNGYTYYWNPNPEDSIFTGPSGWPDGLDVPNWKDTEATLRFSHYLDTETDWSNVSASTTYNVHTDKQTLSQEKHDADPVNCIPLEIPSANYELDTGNLGTGPDITEYLPGVWYWRLKPEENVLGLDPEVKLFGYDVSVEKGYWLPEETTFAGSSTWQAASTMSPAFLNSDSIKDVTLQSDIETSTALIQLYMGGVDEAGSLVDRLMIGVSTEEGTVWEDLSLLQINPPSTRSQGRMVYSPGKNQAVLLGGVDSSGTFLQDAHLLDLKTLRWAQLPNVPDARTNYEAVLRSKTNEVWLFGGTSQDTQGATVYHEDILVLDMTLKSWRTIDIDGLKDSGLVNQSVIYDRFNDRFFRYGGTHGATTNQHIHAYYAYTNDDEWSAVSNVASPSSSSSKVPLLYNFYTDTFVILLTKTDGTISPYKYSEQAAKWDSISTGGSMSGTVSVDSGYVNADNIEVIAENTGTGERYGVKLQALDSSSQSVDYVFAGLPNGTYKVEATLTMSEYGVTTQLRHRVDTDSLGNSITVDSSGVEDIDFSLGIVESGTGSIEGTLDYDSSLDVSLSSFDFDSGNNESYAHRVIWTIDGETGANYRVFNLPYGTYSLRGRYRSGSTCDTVHFGTCESCSLPTAILDSGSPDQSGMDLTYHLGTSRLEGMLTADSAYLGNETVVSIWLGEPDMPSSVLISKTSRNLIHSVGAGWCSSELPSGNLYIKAEMESQYISTVYDDDSDGNPDPVYVSSGSTEGGVNLHLAQ